MTYKVLGIGFSRALKIGINGKGRILHGKERKAQRMNGELEVEKSGRWDGLLSAKDRH